MRVVKVYPLVYQRGFTNAGSTFLMSCYNWEDRASGPSK